MASKPGRSTYWIAVGVAVFVSLFQMWINLAVGIVGNEDNPANQGFFGVVVTAIACAFVARGKPAEMARAMLAVAGVQAFLALMLATAPSNARDVQPILVLSSAFTAAWVISAVLFWRSGRASA